MSNKIYTVVKDGEELEKLRTLTAAKKLADTEGGEVFLDGKRVYQARESGYSEKPDQPEAYRLTKLMNERRHPSLDAEIVSIRQAGTRVQVIAIENDWLHLVGDTFILYGSGEFAEKAR